MSNNSSQKIVFGALDVFVISFGEGKTLNCGFDVLTKLREEGVSTDGAYFNKSLKAQMRLADSLNSKYVLIIGDEEIKKDKIILRDMSGKVQKEIQIKNIIEEVKNVTSRTIKNNL